MKKTFLLKTMLLLFALIAGVSGSWATDVTFKFGTGNTCDVSSTNAVTKDGVTVQITKNGATNDPNFQSGHVRLQAGNKMTISCNQVITKVVFTYTANQYADELSTSGCFNTGSYSYSSSSTTGTWTGSTTNLEIVNRASTQTRFSQIVVTYASAPVINATSPVNYAADITTGEIPYTISSPVSGKSLNATSDDAWISNISVGSDKVTFNMTENEGEARTGTITLSYEGATSKDITINQAAAVTKYTVTIETPTNGTLVVQRAGVNVVSGSKIPDGTTLDIIVTPNTGYKKRNWQAVDASTHTITSDNNTTYTINGHDVTFKANFDPLEQYTYTWNVNGSTVKSETLYEGEDVFFPDVADMGGKAFYGWVTTSTVNPDEVPSIVTTSNVTATANTTYYAVFADKDDATSIATLTESEIKSNFSNDAMAYGDDPKSYTDNTDGITWTAKAYATEDAPWIQLRKNDVVAYLRIKASKNISNVKLTLSNAGTTGTDAIDWSKNSNFTGKVLILSSASAGATEGDLATTETQNIKGDVSVSLTTTADDIYVQTTTGARIWGVEVTYGTITYSNYSTSFLPFTISEAATDGTLFYTTFSSAYPFEVPEEIKGEFFEVSEISVENGKLNVVSYEEGDVVPANTGVMVASTAAGNYSFNVSSNEGESYLEGLNYLLPTGNGITAEQMAKDGFKFYALTKSGGKLGFWYVVEGGAAFDYNVANRAYLAVPTSALGPSSAIGFGFDDETTGIQNIERTINDNRYYTLDGRRVAEPTKGIYIINGKKVVIK